MAKLERVLQEDFDAFIARVTEGILAGSSSASLEARSDFSEGGARCSVLVFERYSYTGGNRLSMNLTLFQSSPGAPLHLSAITAGGSQGVFLKFNTIGENAFLQKLEEIL